MDEARSRADEEKDEDRLLASDGHSLGPEWEEEHDAAAGGEGNSRAESTKCEQTRRAHNTENVHAANRTACPYARNPANGSHRMRGNDGGGDGGDRTLENDKFSDNPKSANARSTSPSPNPPPQPAVRFSLPSQTPNPLGDASAPFPYRSSSSGPISSSGHIISGGLSSSPVSLSSTAPTFPPNSSNESSSTTKDLSSTSTSARVTAPSSSSSSSCCANSSAVCARANASCRVSDVLASLSTCSAPSSPHHHRASPTRLEESGAATDSGYLDPPDDRRFDSGVDSALDVYPSASSAPPPDAVSHSLPEMTNSRYGVVVESRPSPRADKRWSDPERGRLSPGQPTPSSHDPRGKPTSSTTHCSNPLAASSSSGSFPLVVSRVKNQSPSSSPAHNSSSSSSSSRQSPGAEDARRQNGVVTVAPGAHAASAASTSSANSSPSFNREQQSRQQLQQPRRRMPPPPLGAAVQEGGAVGGASVDNSPQYNWQSTKSTVKERLCFVYNNETMADVHFKVGKGANIQNIPAHKFVLSIGSAVFDAMFNGGMATRQNEIELPDVEPAAFLATLRFIYTDEVTIGPETVMTTLYAAKKYAVPALEAHCVEFLKKNLAPDNSFMLLTQARLFDEPQLAALCLETIDKNTQEAVGAEGFCDVDLETLCVVLERDSLGIREAKLFAAVAKWSEAECNRRNIPLIPENRRQVLGRSLRLIRFPLMSIEEFASGPAQSGLLLDSELVSLFLYFTVNPKPNVSFADVPRCCLTGKEQVVNRFCQTESRWGYSGTSDRLRFMVNRKIFIVGFGLYGSIHGATEYAVNMQIAHTDSSRVVGQNETSFPCDGTNATFRVMFKEPVEIYPNMNYTAACTLKGPDSYYGTKGQRKVVHESVSRERVVFTFSYAAGSNNGTSVEDGQIPEIIFYT